MSIWTSPRRPDTICLTVLIAAIAALVWQRAFFDIWIARHDNLTAYLPWYTLLGERLRAGEIPGWNPYQFSGTPFAADPQSGWTYLPAMLPFTVLDPVPAMTAKLAIELLVPGLATYALIRVLRFSPVAALAGAVVMTFGPLSFQTAYCCTVRSHIAAWMPLALLGAELALQAKSRPARLAAIGIGAFGYSQMLAGWLGQGTLNAAIVIGIYALVRAFGARPDRPRGKAAAVRTVLRGLAVALGIGLFGAALNAAALIPRLVVNAETNLAGGDYTKLPSGYDFPPYELPALVAALVSDDFTQRRMTIPATGLILAVLVLVLAPRTRTVLLMAGITIGTFLVAASLTPLYDLFTLIPQWKQLHDHYPAQVTAQVMIGPAILAAAALDTLPRLARNRRTVISMVLIAAGTVATFLWLGSVDEARDGLAVPAVVSAITGIAVALLIITNRPRLVIAAQALIVALILIEPTGLEIAGSLSRWDPVPGWEEQWSPDPALEAAMAIYTDTEDPEGAGGFLRARMAESGPFRYAGYGGLTWPDTPGAMVPYTQRRAQPQIAAMLVNGRSIFLDLYDMQGYNPIQLSRYTDYVLALNTIPQDYHLANLRPQGIGSPLLDALGVRFILVDARIPPDREDAVAIAGGREPVFETEHVRVYENPNAFPHAWIVHETVVTTRDDAIDRLLLGEIDLRTAALIETDDVAVQPLPAGASESATITRYDPERIELRATAAADGLLVLSEIHESGWRAYVNGDEVGIVPANVALRGIPLPAGQHTVVLEYDPPALRVGLAVSMLSHALLIGTLVAVVIAIRRNGQPAR